METEDLVKTEGEDIVAEAKKLADESWVIDQHNRLAAVDDLQFRVGDQWDTRARESRGNRPCLTFNELGKFLRQVTGESRQSKPQIEVHPVDSEGDPAVAEIFEGLIREIEHRSKAQTAYNTAVDSSSACGFSYLMVTSAYTDDKSFNQELCIKRVTNPFGMFHDLTAKMFDGSDMQWALDADSVISNVEFKRLYPGKAASSSELSPAGSQGHMDWWPEGSVRIGHYYKRVPIKRVIAEVKMLDESIQVQEIGLKPGEYILDPMGQPSGQVLRSRTVDSWKVKIFTLSGSEILEENDWPGTSIPVVPMYGEETFIEGKRYLNGIIRYAKDPQRFKNYFLTSVAERLMTSHRNPYMGTEEMFEGYEQEWNRAHLDNKAFIRFNPDTRVPGAKPSKDPPTEFSMAESQMLGVASQGLYDTTGIYPPSLGQRSNEVSGRAILARQKESDTGTFVYLDNRDIAIQRVGEILVEVIPKVYDSSRVMRIRGRDNRISFVPVNAPIQGLATPGGMTMMNAVTQMPVPDNYKKPVGSTFSATGLLIDMKTGRPIYMNDLQAGRFDVMVSVGSSHGTKRQEAVNLLLEFSRAYPPSVPFIGDLIAKNLDIVEGEELARRFQMLMQMAQAQQMGAPGAAPNKAQDEFGNQQAKGQQL